MTKLVVRTQRPGIFLLMTFHRHQILFRKYDVAKIVPYTHELHPYYSVVKTFENYAESEKFELRGMKWDKCRHKRLPGNRFPNEQTQLILAVLTLILKCNNLYSTVQLEMISERIIRQHIYRNPTSTTMLYLEKRKIASNSGNCDALFTVQITYGPSLDGVSTVLSDELRKAIRCRWMLSSKMITGFVDRSPDSSCFCT